MTNTDETKDKFYEDFECYLHCFHMQTSPSFLVTLMQELDKTVPPGKELWGLKIFMVVSG